ncbi:Frigida-like [Dillenia turbinata]|uniref:FRIGIDA-like protein n=1 Tax=Dillenia turbinata TaxID=194707 RepID=A0AAN8V5V6_9MAGN
MWLIQMVDTKQVVDLDTITSLREQLGKALLDLESCNGASDDKIQWNEIEEHFLNLEASLKKKCEELEVKEKEFEENESKIRASLAEREAAVSALEQGLLDRIQELKDAAVTAIAETWAIHKPPEPLDVGDNKDSKVSSSLDDIHALLSDSEEKSPDRTGENVEGGAVEVKPRQELMQLCEQMDAKGLLNFTMQNRKYRTAIRGELSVALESATEPARLVLDSLEGFFPPDESTQQGENKDAALIGMRRSCITLLEAMTNLLTRADPGLDHLLNPETKQQAKAIADDWKPKLDNGGTDAANGNSLEVEAFLQLLATYKIASEFDEDELCKLVLAVARRRQAPELCRSLGLAHKIPGVVGDLINTGRQIDAVHFIHAFELTETFPPVPLLKTYLKDLRRNSQGKGGNGTGGQDDANSQELAALKSVTKCVKDYKLEADYPLDPLLKRVAQLEKSKSDKKRAAEFGKHQQKKPRTNGGFYGYRAPATAVHAAPVSRQAPLLYADRTYGGVPERYSHPASNTYEYQSPNQAAFPPQANDQRYYGYSQGDGVPAASYNNTTSNYGTYMGSGLEPSDQAYM